MNRSVAIAEMIYMGQSGFIKVPLEVIEEIEAFDDDLGAWVKTVQVRDALLLAEDADVEFAAGDIFFHQ